MTTQPPTQLTIELEARIRDAKLYLSGRSLRGLGGFQNRNRTNAAASPRMARFEQDILDSDGLETGRHAPNEIQHVLGRMKPLAPEGTVFQELMRCQLIGARSTVATDPAQNVRTAGLVNANALFDARFCEANLDRPVISNLENVDAP